jgi:hypothetical protein
VRFKGIIISFVLLLISPSPLRAADYILPSSLGWGLDAGECDAAIVSEGYIKEETNMDGMNDPIWDRSIQNSAAENGLQIFSYGKKGSGVAQRLTVYVYKDMLCRVSISFEGFGKGFRDEVVSDLSGDLSSKPQAITGMQSGVDTYIWRRGKMDARFMYKEIPKLINFAQIEYNHIPLIEELRRKGLM